MLKALMGMIGLGGIVAVTGASPAMAALDNAALDQAKASGTIEALEDFLYRHPGAVHAVAMAEAKFECAMGQQWKCGDNSGQPDPRRHEGYGG